MYNIPKKAVAVGTVIVLGVGSIAYPVKNWHNNKKAESLAELDTSLMAQIMREMPNNTLTKETFEGDIRMLKLKDPYVDEYKMFRVVSGIPREGYEVTLVDRAPFGGGPSKGDTLDGTLCFNSGFVRFGYDVKKENLFPQSPEIKHKYWGRDREIFGIKVKAEQWARDYSHDLSRDFLTRLKATRSGRKNRKI